MHSLGPNKTFFFSCIWHCRPSAAWLSLAWCICLWRGEKKKKKGTCISLPQLNCSEVLPSRTGQMWGRDLQQTTPSLSPLIPLYKSLSITAAAVVLWIPLVFVCCKGRRGRALGRCRGKWKCKNKRVAAALHAVHCSTAGQEQHVWSIMPRHIPVRCVGVQPSPHLR